MTKLWNPESARDRPRLHDRPIFYYAPPSPPLPAGKSDGEDESDSDVAAGPSSVPGGVAGAGPVVAGEESP